MKYDLKQHTYLLLIMKRYEGNQNSKSTFQQSTCFVSYNMSRKAFADHLEKTFRPHNMLREELAEY